MAKSLLLGIDIGTTSTKVILIDNAGNILAVSSRPATLHSPRANWAEEDPSEWWENLCQAIPECLEIAGVDSSQVQSVGVSGMVPTTILVDHNGVPLRRSIQQNDARSHVEIQEFKTHIDESWVFQQTGSAITQQSIGPKLRWIAKNQPELFRQAKWVMGSYDYINYRLTGQPIVESNWALESGLYDLHQQDWIDELIGLAQIRRENLPQVFNPSDVIGKISAESARAVGLTEGTPVVAGSADHVASAFSVGLKQNGDLLVKLGGAGDILYSIDRLEIEKQLFIDYHVIPDLYLMNGCMASSGSIIKWYREKFAPELDYSDLDATAIDVPPGSNGLMLLPYFIGEKTPVFDPLARGILFGLSLQHTRAHIYHAILEGISYGFLHHLEVLSSRGFGVNRVRVANGGAKSTLWRQVTADVIGYPLEEVANHPGSSLGAAFVAGMGIEAFNSWDDIENYIQIAGTTHPDLEKHDKYSQLFELYKQLYLSNTMNFVHLSKIEGITT